MFVGREPTILHADLDAFYASVEQRDDPRLKGRPVIVGGGVVLAASYEAKARGVRTAMDVRSARRLCPEAVVVAPRMSAYSEASKAVYRVFDEATPLVEGLSIDEAFLDVRGLRRLAGTSSEIAERLRRDVLEQVGLPITVGVARTKFLAKVASGVAKPDGLLVVPPDRELAFLHPLPIGRLWGVGRVTAAKLNDLGIVTVHDVAELQEGVLGVHSRARPRPATPRALAQPRPPPGAPAAPPALDRVAISFRPTAEIGGERSTQSSSASSTGSRAGWRESRARGPHGGVAPPLRRLLTGDPVDHAAVPDRAYAHDPRCRARAAGRVHADDRAPGPDPRRDHGREPRRRR